MAKISQTQHSLLVALADGAEVRWVPGASRFGIYSQSDEWVTDVRQATVARLYAMGYVVRTRVPVGTSSVHTYTITPEGRTALESR